VLNPTSKTRDFWGGALVTLLGLGAMLEASTYRLGTLGRMGPGFFPIAVGAVLALVGLCLMISARFAAAEPRSVALAPEWRGWLLICLGIVSFVLVGRYGGLLPATFAIVFISALADRANSIATATVLALALVAVCVVIFWWFLRIQLPLFRWG